MTSGRVGRWIDGIGVVISGGGTIGDLRGEGVCLV